jgi:hypothetical protein
MTGHLAFLASGAAASSGRSEDVEALGRGKADDYLAVRFKA